MYLGCRDESELFALMEKQFSTAIICDMLDEQGYRNQNMDSALRPLSQTDVIVGRAKTLLAADVYAVPEVPYEAMIKAMDTISKDEVVVVATNRSQSCAFWGELMSTSAQVNGARGAVVHGCVRDTKQMKEMGFKIFFSGLSPLDSKGRCTVIDSDCVIECGGVMVAPGDIIIADCDGIAVIPKVVEKDVIESALEKIKAEKNFIRDLRAGKTLSEAFTLHNVL
jgi:regulator of RNase E activity RraA